MVCSVFAERFILSVGNREHACKSAHDRSPYESLWRSGRASYQTYLTFWSRFNSTIEQNFENVFRMFLTSVCASSSIAASALRNSHSLRLRFPFDIRRLQLNFRRNFAKTRKIAIFVPSARDLSAHPRRARSATFRRQSFIGTPRAAAATFTEAHKKGRLYRCVKVAKGAGLRGEERLPLLQICQTGRERRAHSAIFTDL